MEAVRSVGPPKHPEGGRSPACTLTWCRTAASDRHPVPPNVHAHARCPVINRRESAECPSGSRSRSDRTAGGAGTSVQGRGGRRALARGRARVSSSLCTCQTACTGRATPLGRRPPHHRSQRADVTTGGVGRLSGSGFLAVHAPAGAGRGPPAAGAREAGDRPPEWRRRRRPAAPERRRCGPSRQPTPALDRSTVASPKGLWVMNAAIRRQVALDHGSIRTPSTRQPERPAERSGRERVRIL